MSWQPPENSSCSAEETARGSYTVGQFFVTVKYGEELPPII